ncbi:hypothetical protein ACJVDH_10805 [Pedobacter sp. AW1-32]|uniref:hypothetical protein n=1 Tax=Pedobacter sp. AW1-32 TaxID=3383026 RepID=UPI003FF120EC
MQTLAQQGVSIITQTRAVLSKKYGYVAQSGYNNQFAELLSEDGQVKILLVEENGALSFEVGVHRDHPQREKLQQEITILVTDILDIVSILN